MHCFRGRFYHDKHGHLVGRRYVNEILSSHMRGMRYPEYYDSTNRIFNIRSPQSNIRSSQKQYMSHM
ncbi:hypothetical protein H5410_006223 [Solanum commersonii]|uniref:Uncharacterized protein n=1 Tax=Solanum commersonii TaxID=4109 RepID=A0A9J6A8R5_SOLCO|nr:hypothetical protein H5410_006223 [Solanum commersonii]